MKTLTVRMKSNDMAEILVYDQIGVDPWFGEGISPKDFREQVKALKAKTINLRINSPGGSVFDASAMLNALDEHPAAIIVDVDGIAASAASFLAMAGARRKGDSIRIATNGLLMIHNPYGGVMGTSGDMRRTADLLDKVKGQILDSYGRKIKDRKKLSGWMDAETWFTGQEAVDAGFADEVTGPISVAAFADLEKIAARFKFKHVPEPKAPPGPTPEQLAEHARRRAIADKWTAKVKG